MLIDTPSTITKVSIIHSETLPAFGASGELILHNGNLYVYDNGWTLVGMTQPARSDIHLFFQSLPNSSATVFELYIPVDTVYAFNEVYFNTDKELVFSAYVNSEFCFNFGPQTNGANLQCKKGDTLTIRYTHCMASPENVVVFIPGLQGM